MPKPPASQARRLLPADCNATAPSIMSDPSQPTRSTTSRHPCSQDAGTGKSSEAPDFFDPQPVRRDPCSRPLAIIIKGNPKYLEDPRVKFMAEAFYAAIEAVLLAGGLRVEFDPGEPHTVPKAGALAWVGHSRGADRLQYAPEGVFILEVIGEAGHCHRQELAGLSQGHYQLSSQDKAALEKMAAELLLRMPQPNGNSTVHSDSPLPADPPPC